MSDWSLLEREWLPVPPPLPYDPFQFAEYETYFEEKVPPPPQAHYSTPSPPVVVMSMSPPPPPPPMPVPAVIPEPQQMSPPQMMLPPQLMPPQLLPSQLMPPPPVPLQSQPPVQIPPYVPPPKGDSPRELRNKAEKQRRDKLNQSIAELAAMVPPVVASSRKIDKTGVLRLTAHYLRAHQHVFGDSIGQAPEFCESSTQAVLSLLNGFLLTTTYKGLIVVVSENITEYLGYSELELLGHSIFTITHEDDHQMLREQLTPRSVMLAPNGQLIAPDHKDGKKWVAEALASEKRRFVIRLKKLGTVRSEPSKYVTCHVEGSLRKSDRACQGSNRCCQMVRRARARGENPCASGNDVVFIGVVRPTKDTFINESALETYNMQYRTRHSIDGEIIQCEQRLSLITGYMTHEVYGVNAMNFIHRDEVRWVIIALQEMYKENNLYGESCYRLMTKNGQFIYLQTRGRLDVDENSRVTSFVCTNTVVDEDEGKELIRLMKAKFSLATNKHEERLAIAANTDEASDNQIVAVEDPKQLEKQILNLVTNLPSPQRSDDSPNMSPDGERRFAIIPPKKERIVSAIEKIYDVIKMIPKQPSTLKDELPSPKTEPENMSSETTITTKQQNSSETSMDSLDSGALGIEYMADLSSFNINNSPQSFIGYDSNGFGSDYLLPGPSTGTKRPNKFDDQDQENLSKKKILEMLQEPMPENATTETPALENLFDEAFLAQQIDSAVDSIDESFNPDMLISKELEDLLNDIEGTQTTDNNQ